MRWMLPSLLVAFLAGGCTDPASTPVASRLHFTAVAAGARHTCALEQAGALWCWGSDESGQLGTDSLRSTWVPVAVAAAPAFSAIFAADDRSCGMTPANQLYCWGDGRLGQLGDGRRENRNLPTPVAGSFRFQQIALGDSVTCGFLASDSAGYCWGRGIRGGLGNQVLADSAAPGTPLAYPWMRYATLTAGSEGGCAITTEGVTRCWGRGYRGQNGNAARVGLGGPEVVASSVRFVRVFAGAEHRCALTAAGQAYCWGRGDGGELGNGLLADTAAPTPVAGGLSFLSLTLGAEHTCGLTADGRAYCWGDNFQGRLGTGGPPGSQPVPAPVDAPVHFVQLSAGKLHSCAVADDGGVWCWGSGAFGQLGNDQPISQPLPLPVPLPR